MPQQVIRKEYPGVICHEYTPQELELIKLNRIIDEYERKGQFKFASPTHETVQTREHKRRYR